MSQSDSENDPVEEQSLPPSWGPMRSFGRIKARTLKPRQADLFESLMPRLELNDASIKALLQSPPKGEVWLEIGFGGGEHMATQAQNNPDVLILGCEPFLNGVGSALRHIDERALDNIRLLSSDVRPFLDKLPDAFFDRIFILFPDPWPKARHQKRRLIQMQIVDTLARVLKIGGSLRFATDWADYANWTLERFMQEPRFEWQVKSSATWNTPPNDHATTRYEVKGLGDCKPVFFDFTRIDTKA